MHNTQIENKNFKYQIQSAAHWSHKFPTYPVAQYGQVTDPLMTLQLVLVTRGGKHGHWTQAVDDMSR